MYYENVEKVTFILRNTVCIRNYAKELDYQQWKERLNARKKEVLAKYRAEKRGNISPMAKLR